jgi:hypothetical protein
MARSVSSTPTSESVTARSRSTSSWSRNAGALFRVSARSIVVLPPNADEPLRLGGAAAVVFAVLDEPCSELALVDALRERGADEASVREALAMLRAADVVALDPVDGGER